MMIKSILIIAVFFCAACASPQKFEEKILKPWKGKEISELVLQWGIPSQVYPLPNKSKTLYQFNSVSGSVKVFHAGGSNKIVYWCTVTAIVEGQNIDSFMFEGTNCRSN